MPEQAWMLPLIALLPLLAAVAGLLLRRLPPLVHALLGCASLAVSAGLALVVNSQFSQEVTRAVWSIPWISPPQVQGWNMPPIPLALQVDYTQFLFIMTTCLIGIGVLLFAIRERRADPQAAVFHSLLTLFCGSMLLFLVSDTLLLLFIAWELMGLAGYLLIRHKGTAEANRAARQAFWTTRATDFGLLFAIFIFMFGFSRYGVNMMQLSQVSIGDVVNHINTQALNAVNQGAISKEMAISLLQPEFSYISLWMGIAALLVLLAVLGKAAMLPLSFWLPDAMVAPAPVSALLHSATLVAAGPLLLSRMLFGRTVLPLEAYGEVHLHSAALLWAVMLGGVTMLIGAICACCQSLPKRLLAWSTVSQLGLCVLGSAALAVEASRFQLLSHAWFKAALFLGVGIIVAIWHERRAASAGEEQTDSEPGFAELRGTADSQPLLFWLGFMPAALSLAGVIGLAGYFGKEQILSALLQRGGQSYNERLLGEIMPGMPVYWQAGAWLLLLSIPFTAAYCARLLAGLRGGSVEQRNPPATEPAAQPVTGWNLAIGISIAMAFIGSIGLTVYWFSYRGFFASRPGALEWAANFDLMTGGLAMLLVLAGAAAGMLSMSQRGLAAPTPLLSAVNGAFREGLYFKQIFTAVFGGLGEFLAILAGIADIRLIDWLATRGGAGGRALANASAWLDIHFVDGIRWWCCEIWWVIKRVHGRYWQNGQIQNYMFVLLIGAVLLCLVVAWPLNEALGRILGRYN